jgi:NAD(P)-dependent dehydrogenase (short-subunit alcohol dehydrogenase family)
VPHESIYCGAKAGVTLFAQAVGLEQKDKEYGFEVITIGPGTVDTYMYQVARSKNKEDYLWVDLAKQMYEKGELEKPGKVAEKIYIILSNRYDQGQYVKAFEV